MKLNSLDNLPIAILLYIEFILPNRFVSYSKIFDGEGLSLGLIGQKRQYSWSGY